MTIAAALRRARHRSDLSLRTVSARSGVPFSNLSSIENARQDATTATVERLTRALGITFVPVDVRGRSTAAETVDALADCESRGRSALAYRQFLQLADDLNAVDPVTRVVLAAEPPSPSASRWADAVAALVEQRLTEAGAPIPAWVQANKGQPEHGWEPQRDDVPLPVHSDPVEVSNPFLRRGILIEANELQSA